MAEEEETQWHVSEFFEPDKLSITQWSEDDRPREKLERLGPSALSSAELLAILIGTGSTKETAVDLMKKIMKNCGNSLKTLGRMSIDELKTYNGIGEAKAITILAACELGRRRQQEEAKERLDMSNAKSIYDYMHPLTQDLATEEAWILLLNHNFKLITDAIRLSHGGLTETAVDVRVIVKHAILNNATVVVLLHNHPSGNTHPSGNDNRITKEVNDALHLMRIHFADHIIITDGDYYSYREEGKL